MLCGCSAVENAPGWVDDELEDDRVLIGPTFREQIVKARRGQGVFRANVLLHETCCRVTLVDDPRHLKASHIKPWRDATDNQRLDSIARTSSIDIGRSPRAGERALPRTVPLTGGLVGRRWFDVAEVARREGPAGTRLQVLSKRTACCSDGNSMTTTSDQGRCWHVFPQGPWLCHSTLRSGSDVVPT